MFFKNRKNNLLLKGISFSVALSFLTTQVVFADRSYEVTRSPGHQVTKSPATSDIESFVTISDSFVPDSTLTLALSPQGRGDGKKLVVYIEDAHGNISAQKNIAGAINAVSAQAQLTEPWIALEGTEVGEIDHRVLSAFPHEPTRKKVADYFLNSGEIDGADYYASLYNPSTRLFGVDDGLLAEKNRESYRNYLASKDDADKALKDLRQTADFLKKKIYFGDVVRLDRSVERFEHNPSYFQKHLLTLQELAKKNKISLVSYSHISKLIELKELEAKTTQKNATQNQSRFSTLLKQLEGVQVFSEIQELTDAIWQKLLSYREAQDAYQIDKIVQFYEKLFSFALLPEEYADYFKNPSQYSLDSLKERIADYNFLLRPKTLRPTEETFSVLREATQHPLNFYELAHQRNDALLNNLINLITNNSQPITFFIAGGFHRKEITADLKEKNIPYIVLSPKIFESKGADKYWQQMGGLKTSLDLAFIALSTAKLRDSLKEPAFRAKVALANIGALDFTPETKKTEIVGRYRVSLAPSDQKVVGRVEQNLERSEPQQVSLRLPDNIIHLKFNGNNQSLEMYRAASLGSSIVSINMEKVQALLAARGISFDNFQPFTINPFPRSQVTYEVFRNNVLPVIVNTAVASGLKLNLKAQQFLLDQTFSTPELKKKFEAAFQNIRSTESISFDFIPSSNYLFSGGLAEGKITVNSAALQGLSSDYAMNAFFASIVYSKLIRHQGKSSTDDDAKLFYQIMDSLVRASEKGAKKDIGYQGEVVSRWISGVTELTMDDKEANELSDIIYEIHSSGFAPGMVLKGHFKILRFLAQGGMGAVWQAVDQDNGNFVVVKQVLPQFLQKEDMRIRFFREVRALQRNQNNPHIAKLISSQLPDETAAEKGGTGLKQFDRIFYVMEWAPGKTLEKLIEEDSLNLDEKIKIIIQLLRGLEQVHKTQTIHRDLKPDNMKVDTENHNFVRFFDFGLARKIDEPDDTQSSHEMTVTLANAAVGTPHYMSPEQAKGEKDKVKYTSDIFAVGSILYRLTTGRYPFGGSTVLAVLTSVAMGKPEPLGDEVDPVLKAIIQKALKKEPQDRYQTAGEFAEDLENFLKGEPPIYAKAPKTIKPHLEPGRGTARVGKVDETSRRKSTPVRQDEKVVTSEKRGMPLTWLIGGSVTALAIVGGFLLSGKKETAAPPKEGPAIALARQKEEEDKQKALAIKKAEDEKAKIAQQEKTVDDQIKKIKGNLEELRGIVANIDPAWISMKETLAKTEKAVSSANLATMTLEAINQIAIDADESAKQIEGKVKDVQWRFTGYDQKRAETESLLKSIENSDNNRQRDEAKSLRTSFGQIVPKAKPDDINKLSQQMKVQSDRIKGVVKEAQQAKLRTPAELADAEIQKVKDLIAELIKGGDFKALDESLAQLTELNKKIGDKTKELVKAYTDTASEVTKFLKIASPKEEDRKNRQAIEAKLPPLTQELTGLTDSAPVIQKQIEDFFPLFSGQVTRINESVAKVSALSKEDPKLADKLAEIQKEAEKAKPVKDALAIKETVAKKAVDEINTAILLSKLETKISAARLAVTQVDTVWNKNNNDKYWNELRKPLADPAKKKELDELNKKIAEARSKLPEALGKFKRDFSLLPGTQGLIQEIDEYRRLSQNPKPTPKQLELLQKSRSNLEQVLTNEKYNDQPFLKNSLALFSSVDLTIDGLASTETLWQWNKTDFEGLNITVQNNQDMRVSAKSSDVKEMRIIDKKLSMSDARTRKVGFTLANPDLENNISISYEVVQPKTNDATIISTRFFIAGRLFKIFATADSIDILHLPTKDPSSAGDAWKRVKNIRGDAIKQLEGGKYVIKVIQSEKQVLLMLNGSVIHTIDKQPSENILRFEIMKENGGPVDIIDIKKERLSDDALNKLITPQKINWQWDGKTLDNFARLTESNLKIVRETEMPAFKGKSLGKLESSQVFNIYESAQSELTSGIIIFPYDKRLIGKLLQADEHLPFINTNFIFITNSAETHAEAQMMFGKLQRIKGYRMQIQRIDPEINQRILLNKDILNNILEKAAAFFQVNKDDLGRPVIFETNDFMVKERLISDDLNRASVIPVEYNKQNFINNFGYRTAYLTTAAAVSKGDNTNYGYRIDDGKISLISSLIAQFQQSVQAVFALARAA